MSVPLRDLPPESVLLTLNSPEFTIPPPALHNRDLMPAEVLAAMAESWERGSFAPSQVRFALLRDVVITMEGLVFDRDGRLFACSVTQHSEAEIAHGATWVARAGDRAPRHAGPCVLCKKRGGRNYGHWLLEMLPKMHLATRHLALPGLRHVVPAADGAMAPVIAGSAERLGVAAGQRIVLDHGPAWFDELVVIDGLTSHGGFMSPLVMAALDALAETVPDGGIRKLFVTRTSVGYRNIANQQAVFRAAAAAGYSAIDPGRMPLAQQIACFKGAREIVGIMGAAMTNIAFAAAGARVTLLAPAGMPDTFFWFIAGLRGLGYSEIRCRQTGPVRGITPWDTDIVVDPADFPAVFRNDGVHSAVSQI